MERFKDKDKADLVKKVVVAALEGKALSNFNKTEIVEALKLLGSHCRPKPLVEDVTKLLDKNESQTSTELDSTVHSDIKSASTNLENGSSPDASNVARQSKEDKNSGGTSKSQKICKFFIQKKCRHFKNPHKCAFLHPLKCEVFMKFGKKAKANPNGCDQVKCDKYHPKLCRLSVKSKTCDKAKCTFAHLVGTKHIKTPKSAEIHSTNKKLKNQSDKSVSNMSQNQSFLDVHKILQRLDELQAQMNNLTRPQHQQTPIHVPTQNQFHRNVLSQTQHPAQAPVYYTQTGQMLSQFQ